MAIDLAVRVKNGVVKGLVRGLLEDAGYQVVPVGYESGTLLKEVQQRSGGRIQIAGVTSLDGHSPDFFVFDTSSKGGVFVDVRFRSELRNAFFDDLDAQLAKEPEFTLVLALGVEAGKRNAPDLSHMVRCCRLRTADGRVEISRDTTENWAPLRRDAKVLWRTMAPLRSCFPKAAPVSDENYERLRGLILALADPASAAA
ncbi:MAG: hypothetical protein U1E28_18485 [Beijerinckiaceae bacterium]